jgi:ribosomal protein S18 acetylase RimI-like enzyme
MRRNDVIPLATAFGWPFEGIERRWTEAESGDREIFVADVEGRPAGSVSLNIQDDVPGLLHLFALDVAPAHRRRGIGTVLIRRVEEEAAARALPGVWLDVEVANGDARRLYERMGYRRKQGVVVNKYTAYPSGEKVEETCYRMVKRFWVVS